ncbi:MAG: PKD domain-containing protein [Candidatus Bathyarchaeota archaeon]|nr:MAG: PKD domain-containing protein [Candidatus Bathyarchaeota archaeon]
MIKTKGIILTTLVSTIMILGSFTCFVSAAESNPTIWVTIHRIQATQSSEYNSYWKYSITVNDQITDAQTQDYTCQKTGDDIIIDRDDSFTVKNQNVYITLTVYKSEQGKYETADISSLGTAFDCVYNLATNEIGGEEITVEDGYYKTSGDYDGNLNENDATVWLVISDNYDAPVANAGEDQTVSVRELVNFDASLSKASEGSSIVKVEWDFNGDGVIDADKETASFRFNQNGNYTCKLIITDSIGVTDEDTCIIRVMNKAPIASFTFSPENPSIYDSINIIDHSYDSDGTITSWFWDFGDGTNSTEQNPTHTFKEKNEYQITLTVTDNQGAEDSKTQTLTMTNLPPEACFECNTTDFQIGKEIQFLDNSTDPENKLVSWLWDFGDGNSSNLQTPTHKFLEKGDYNVTLTVADDENANSTYIITISVIEQIEDNTATLWILAVAAIAVASVVFVTLFLRNRKQKSFPEMFTGSKDPEF